MMVDGIPNRPLFFDQKDIIDWEFREIFTKKWKEPIRRDTFQPLVFLIPRIFEFFNGQSVRQILVHEIQIGLPIVMGVPQ